MCISVAICSIFFFVLFLFPICNFPVVCSRNIWRGMNSEPIDCHEVTIIWTKTLLVCLLLSTSSRHPFRFVPAVFVLGSLNQDGPFVVNHGHSFCLFVCIRQIRAMSVINQRHIFSGSFINPSHALLVKIIVVSNCSWIIALTACLLLHSQTHTHRDLLFLDLGIGDWHLCERKLPSLFVLSFCPNHTITHE